MKNPYDRQAPSFDADAIHNTIQRALASAGLDTTSGPMLQVTETIRRALAPTRTSDAALSPGAAGPVIDVLARVVDTDPAAGECLNNSPLHGQAQAPGSFQRHEFSNHAGTRAYKLYVPAQASAAARPLLVMLHGCTQSADDFATGTRMNQLAEKHGCLVLYPEQAAHANSSRCWNWFKQQDQLRDAGEPALLAGMVQAVAARHGADEGRIFVAGLSAGAAMAVVLGQTYPDVFAGVGAHSGLPYGSAHDVPSALAAMKGGRSGLPGLKTQPGRAGAPRRQAPHAVPTIVFHGDRDHTVQHSNGAQIVKQAQDAYRAAAGEEVWSPSTHAGIATGGRRYSRALLANRQGQVHIEFWSVHGAGHAWSGGDLSGSYTDASGPDASAEMLRFFMALARATIDEGGLVAAHAT